MKKKISHKKKARDVSLQKNVKAWDETVIKILIYL